jgi:hypothetical protein
MRETFAGFVVLATIAGSLDATAASAQRGVAAGVAVPGRHYESAPYGAGPGQYDDFGSCERVTQRFDKRERPLPYFPRLPGLLVFHLGDKICNRGPQRVIFVRNVELKG